MPLPKPLRRAGAFVARHHCDLLASAAVLVAFGSALAVTAGLQWPADPDHFRDVAAAQTALDGHLLSDPFYAGEWAWYNPLLPWLVAAASWAADVEPALAHVRLGPWLNLGGPALFYLLAARLAGRPAAVFALVFFLFWTSGNEPVWAYATYTPWLFTAAFAQALFYASGLAILALTSRASTGRAATAGLLLGLTFLTHTAPFVMASAVFATVAAALLARRAVRPAQLAVPVLLAAAVASPFLWSIGIHYGFEVKNPAPMAWEFAPVTWNGLPLLAGAQNWHVLALALVGLVSLWRHPSRVVLMAWLGSAAAFTAWGLAGDVWRTLPALVPTFHFWFYLTALESLLAGAGVWALLRLVLRRRPTWAPGLAAAVVAALVGAGLPGYSTRHDFHELRHRSLSRDASFAKAMRFLRRSSPSAGVVLGTYGAGQLIIGPAGRKTVSVNAWFSNPYVDYEPRARDRDGMFARLKRGDDAGFLTLAAGYGVSKVMGVGEGECEAINRPRILDLEFVSGPVCVFHVRGSDYAHHRSTTPPGRENVSSHPPAPAFRLTGRPSAW